MNVYDVIFGNGKKFLSVGTNAQEAIDNEFNAGWLTHHEYVNAKAEVNPLFKVELNGSWGVA